MIQPTPIISPNESNFHKDIHSDRLSFSTITDYICGYNREGFHLSLRRCMQAFSCLTPRHVQFHYDVQDQTPRKSTKYKFLWLWFSFGFDGELIVGLAGREKGLTSGGAVLLSHNLR
ncbi:hypothetical protein MJO28_016248 [Puccinia striiformis f. sp. tritici]|uniref:Uncharacterized protein n=1 Tax=Puccinia striiformis f. sp. tritici TaxID=168172 RepID=A0ACC0DMP8_9BASI|nr:hypothetical protein MJO28_016248 [Puccinia striiformis f. sp. tritici]